MCVRIALALILGCTLAAPAANGVELFLVGDPLSNDWTQPIQLSPLPNQVVYLKASGGGNISGGQFYLHIGNGDLVTNEPVFTGINFSGGIFDPDSNPGTNPYTITGTGPQAGFEQYLDKGIAFNTMGTTVDANGLIATLTINATGYTNQTFPTSLTWQFTDVPGGTDSQLLGASVTLHTASLSVVPEPGTIAALATLAGAGVPLLIWQRRRAKARRQRRQQRRSAEVKC